MKKRGIKQIGILLLVVLFCTMQLLGCSPDGSAVIGESYTSKDGSKVREGAVVAISSEPEGGFDPTAGWGHGTTPLIQSTLVRNKQDMSIENDLATGYKLSNDGLTWIFKLRDDIKFTNGEPVKVSDVVFTFMTAKNSASSLDLANMSACKETGDNEVSFTLSAPSSTFIYTVASVGIVPEHIYDDNYANEPIGSGPWKFVQWNKGEQIILEPNQDYYGKIPKLKKVTLVFMNEDAAYAAAQAGQVDVALTSAMHATTHIDGMRMEAVSTMDNRGFTLPISPDTGETTEEGYAIGNDVTSCLEIRQALAFGIDRERLAQDALNGFGTPAYSENDGMPWNNPETKIQTDIEKAKKLLSEAGWADNDGDGILEKDGVTAAFTCIYPSGDSVRQAVAMAAAQQAREIGIDIAVEGVSWDDISKRMFSDSVMMGWGSTNPYTSYLLYHSSNKLRGDYYNPEGYNNEIVDGYLEAALRASSVEESTEQWKLAQWDGSTGTSMQGDCPWVWLVNVQHVYFVKDDLDIGMQQLHAHGADWTLLQNLQDWEWD